MGVIQAVGGRLVAGTVFVALSQPIEAQTPVRGTVTAHESDAPIPGAIVRATLSGTSATTDRFGRFTLWLSTLPDTIITGLIGRTGETVVLTSRPAEPLQISLAPAVTVLSDVVVRSATPGTDPERTEVAEWRLPLSAARTVPPAIETDVLRSLALVPAVTFSSPLSARPIVRGYDASQTALRIDGFEVINLYHIGRAFSAFPADAAEAISVVAAPPSARTGETLSGTIDISGNTGSAERTQGGVDLSLASASTWAGGGSRVRWFGGVRAVHFGVLDALSDVDVPYDFQDAYASAALTAGGETRGRITAFASRDHLLDRDISSGMDWSNLLLGGRYRVLDRDRVALTLLLAGTHFSEDVSNIEARRTRLDVRNRFGQLLGGGEISLSSPNSHLALGATLGYRLIGNRIAPLNGDEFPAIDTTFRYPEVAAYAEWSRTLTDATATLGLRMTAVGSRMVWQPRGHLTVGLTPGLAARLGVGRTAQFHHLVSDSRAEPDLAFYDFWKSAAEPGIPVPTADHASLDLDFHRGRAGARLSAFVSRASGLMELRPETEQSNPAPDPFRAGDGRTAGLEAQLAFRGDTLHRSSLAVTYVMARSERRWSGPWRPWAQDRGHLVRIAGQIGLGGRVTAFGLAEAASGVAMTPVNQVIEIPTNPAGETTPDEPTRLAYIFGPENSARSGGTVRVDVGGRFEFQGPWRSRAALGFSIINVGFGPVAPLKPVEPGRLRSPTPGAPAEPIRYERTYDLPAVPTVTFRLEF